VRRLTIAIIACTLLPAAAHASQAEKVPAKSSNVEIKDRQELAAAKAAEKVALSKKSTVDETLAAAKTFLDAYPQSVARDAMAAHCYNKIIETPVDAKRLDYLATYKTMFPTSEHLLELERGSVGAFVAAGKYADGIAVCETYLKSFPDDIETEVRIVDVALEAMRSGSDLSLVGKGKSHGLAAVALFDADKRGASLADPAKWAEYKAKTLPDFYQRLGLIGLASSDDKLAATYLQKSLDLRPADAVTMVFLAEVKSGEYDGLARTFNAMINKESPEAKKIMADAQAKKDEAIALLIKAVVISETSNPQVAGAARSKLELHWKNRHDGTLDGLEDALKAARPTK
jgi:hypothetical protein